MTKVNHPYNKTYVLILASGLGKRFGSEMPKQFHKLEGHSILEHSIQRFEDNKNIDEIIIVTNPLFLDLVETIILYGKSKVGKTFAYMSIIDEELKK